MTESPNTLLSDGTLKILDVPCVGPISGFVVQNGPYGNDPLCSTFYDDVSVRNPVDGSYNFNTTGGKFSFNYTIGGSSQTGIPGFQKVESVIPLAANTRIANPPYGGGPYKAVVTSFNTSMYPDADQIKVTVRVPALLSQDDEGNTNPFSIDYKAEVAVNNGRYVNLVFDDGVETIEGKCTSDYQRTTVYQLPKAIPAQEFNEWKVRVSRVSQNVLSVKTQNEIYVDTISVIGSNLYAYPNLALVGTEIQASQFGNIPTRSYEIMGMLVSVPSGYTPTRYGYTITPFTRQCDIDVANHNVGFTTQSDSQVAGVNAGMAVSGQGLALNSVITYVAPGPPQSQYYFSVSPDPTGTFHNTAVTFVPTTATLTPTAAVYPNVWLGNFQTGVWTDNPAWIFYDLVTNPVHGLGDYILPGSVDKWTLYKIAQFCDQLVDDGNGGLEPQFTCNVVIDSQRDAYNVLLDLASTFRGMLYYANGTIHPVQQQNDTPVFAFTNANVVNGEFSYSNSAKSARATVAKIKWVDPDNAYRENVVYVEDIDGIQKYGYQEKEMTAFACTSQGQAYRFGTWALTTEQLLTETVTFQTDLEGVALKPGDNFAVYDNFRTNKDQAGRIIGISTGHSVVTLDRNVPIEPGYTYSLSAIVPKAQFDASGAITGSDQIALIRNSQIESFLVATGPTSGTNTLTISGSFSSNIYLGSPFILSASGLSTAPTTRAQFYTCLATAEVEPGKIEVLGLQANTGIQFAINTGYTIIDYQGNAPDTTPILPPSNLFVTGITGATANNTFFSSINLTWVNSPSPSLSYYAVSGKTWSGAWERADVIGTGYNFTRSTTGFYSFKVAAVSYGGVYSSFITGGFLVSQQNPLGVLRPLSGIVISNGGDPLYVNSQTGYTGYIGTTPTFSWQVIYDNVGQPIVDAQFISGYQFTIKSLDDSATYYGPVILSGVDNTSYQIPAGAIYSFTGGGAAQRGWKVHVDSVDFYGLVHTGAALKVNNPVMKPPYSSGFVGFNGGLSYNVTPSIQYDTSGIYVWTNQDPTFTPTYSNYTYTSSNLAGWANGTPNTGSYWIWYALTDTFGAAGNPIWGPVSGNANGVFQTFQFDISSQISGAFALLSGNITNMSGIMTGQDYMNLLQVQGLSGQITGLPGTVNTALNVRVNNAVVSSSGALSTQINAVSASVNSLSGYTNAQVGSLQSALATTGGALASWITNLGAVTSGQNASVQIGAQAFVTGSVNGLGGAAVAIWGFNLDANGKVVSMKATSASSFGSTYGTIEFGNATLKSNGATASNGWILTPDGSFTGNNGTFRGALDIGSTSDKFSKPAVGAATFGDTSNFYLSLNTPSVGASAAFDAKYQSTVLCRIAGEKIGGLGAVGAISVFSNDGTEFDILGSLTAGSAPSLIWAGDTNLYRSAADTLKTDDKFIANLGIQPGNTNTLTGLYFDTTVMTWNDSATTNRFGVTTSSKCPAGFGNCASDDTIMVRYDWDTSTATSGSFVATKRDGSSFNGTYRFSYLLLNK